MAAGSFLARNGIEFGERAEDDDAVLDIHLIIHTVGGQGGVDLRRIALVEELTTWSDVIAASWRQRARQALEALDRGDAAPAP